VTWHGKDLELHVEHQHNLLDNVILIG